MPKIIFIAGLKDSGYSTIVDMMLEGSKERLGKHIHLRFEEKELHKMKGMIPDDTRKSVAELYKKIENRLSSALKSGKSVVLEGPLTLGIKEGYLPLVPKRFFESFKPDVFVLFEAKGSSSKIDFIQQEMNRSYAAMYAALGDSLLKIIMIQKGGVKDAIREFNHSMEYFLVK